MPGVEIIEQAAFSYCYQLADLDFGAKYWKHLVVGHSVFAAL